MAAAGGGWGEGVLRGAHVDVRGIAGGWTVPECSAALRLAKVPRPRRHGMGRGLVKLRLCRLSERGRKTSHTR